MEEKGRIAKVENGVAQVEMERTSTCARCGICLQVSGNKPILYVKDSLGVSPGDEVLISLESGELLRAAFLVYILPLFGLVLGYFLGRILFGREGIGILFAGIGFFAVLLFLYRYDKRLKVQKRMEAKIVHIEKISRGEKRAN